MAVNLEKVKKQYSLILQTEDGVERAKLLQHFLEDGMLSYLMGIALAVEERKESTFDTEEEGFPMTFPSEDSMFWSKKRFTFEYEHNEYVFEQCPEETARMKEGVEFTHFISGDKIKQEGHEYVIAMIIEGENEFEALFAFGVPVEGTDTGEEVMYTTLEKTPFSDLLANVYATANQTLG